MSEKEIKICIIYGGPSDEHEVSIKSAENILESVDQKNYNILKVYLHKDMKFEILNDRDGIKTIDEEEFFKYIKSIGIDYVLPILHGEYGEDGQIQKKLEQADIRYFGSDSVSSANAMDKNIAQEIFIENGILIPRTKIISPDNFHHDFNYPVIVKPIDGGSSIGLYKFENEAEYINNIKKDFGSKLELMLQEFVIGREFTCGVIDLGSKVTALPLSEVLLKESLVFDFDTKYTPGACMEVTPASLGNELTEMLQHLAMKCHFVLGCRDVSRTDIILTQDNKMYVLETNTIPGMTKGSFVPAQLKAAGVEIEDFMFRSIKDLK